MSTTHPFQRNAWDILRENALQLLMYALGVVLTGLFWWPLAIVYLTYCALSNVLYMAWVCPYCAHYSLGTCRAGFHLLSARRFKPKAGRTFNGEFRKNVIVMYPGWFMPPIIGLYLLINGFTWPVLGLLIIFSIIGFWLLPEASNKHCEGCETVDCPRRPKLLQIKQ